MVVIQLDFTQLTTRERYKWLIASVIPRPIAWITTQSPDGIVNAAPFSFFNLAANEPPLISLSLLRVNGEMKDTSRNLITQQEGVVHIVTEENVELANLTAKMLESNQSEITYFDIETQAAQKVSVPAIQNATIRIEVRLNHHHVIEHDGRATADHFLLEVIAMDIADSLIDEGHIIPERLKPVSRLAGANYATIGKIFEIKRP